MGAPVHESQKREGNLRMIILAHLPTLTEEGCTVFSNYPISASYANIVFLTLNELSASGYTFAARRAGHLKAE
jgi:hypothetical protein